jgi:hypothetical protein
MYKFNVEGLGSPKDDVANTLFPSTTMKGPIDLPRGVYGIRIGAASEVDQCAVLVGGGIDPGYAGRRSGETFVAGINGYMPAGAGGAGQPSIYKISVARPLIARIDPHTPLGIIPTRVYDSLVSPLIVRGRSPILELEFLETPEEILSCPTRRASYDADVSMTVATTALKKYYVPVFGRAWAALDCQGSGAGASRVMGANGITVRVRGMRFVWSEIDGDVATPGPGVISDSRVYLPTDFLATTTINASAPTYSVEGDTECDMLEVSVGAVDAGELTNCLAFHVRAEDA